MKKLGIIICHRYQNCAAGKCLRSLYNREGAFSIYKNAEIQLVGITTCGGCPGGNIEYAPAEMKRNGAEIIHLATGLVVGYPPCPRIESFCKFIPEKYGIEVVIGTHPIHTSYIETHTRLGTWKSDSWKKKIQLLLTDSQTRFLYD